MATPNGILVGRNSAKRKAARATTGPSEGNGRRNGAIPIRGTTTADPDKLVAPQGSRDAECAELSREESWRVERLGWLWYVILPNGCAGPGADSPEAAKRVAREKIERGGHS